MIADIVPIEQKEFDEQIAYLYDSPVRWLAIALNMGLGVLRRGRITSIADLGQQRTISGDLGGVLSTREYGLDKFLVRHVPEVLVRPDCRDRDSRAAVEGIRAALAAHRHHPRITILRSATDMIVDGNKTAAAYYSVHAEDGDAIELTVYLAMCD